MYRRAEFVLFEVLSWLAFLFACLTLLTAALYFVNSLDFYRSLSLVFLCFSFFFEVQIFMYKITVIEKRLLHLVSVSEQHFRIAKKKESVRVVVYFFIFWAAMMAVVFSFAPAR